MPNIVITDYERTFLNSFAIYDNTIRSYGCLFHYGQCIWKKIQQCSMAVLYKNDDNVKKVFKLFLNLP